MGPNIALAPIEPMADVGAVSSRAIGQQTGQPGAPSVEAGHEKTGLAGYWVEPESEATTQRKTDARRGRLAKLGQKHQPP